MSNNDRDLKKPTTPIDRDEARHGQSTPPSGYGGWLTGAGIDAAQARGEIHISPYDRGQLNPNSYNYRLGSKIRRLASAEVDLLTEEDWEDLRIPPVGLRLMPGECYLGHTKEEFGSLQYASLVTGRSSIGRKFITNHVSAGLIDVGFFGQITLEITVQRPTTVYEDIPFGQIFWFSLHGSATIRYNGKYQGQLGPTQSRMWLDSASREASRAPTGGSPSCCENALE